MKKNYTKNALLLILAVSMNALSSAQIIADGTYKIFNSVNSEVMSINTDPEEDLIVGRAKMAVPDVADDLQLWVFTHQGNDIYKIQNVGDNTTLGVKDGWCGPFGDVQVGFEASSPWVLFKVSLLNTDNYYFEIAFNNDCNFDSTNDPIKVFDIDGGGSGGKINTFRDPMDLPINANQTFQIVEPSTLSTTDIEDLSDIEVVYDNTNGLVIKTGTNKPQSLSVDVFDITGKRVKTESFKSLEQSIAIDLNTLRTGLYITRISNFSEQKSRTFKFVVH